MSLALAVSILVASGALGWALAIDERRRQAPPLPAPLPSPFPTTALLPVRDEEANVSSCLEALLASTAEPSILVIDDGSTDRTAEIVAGIAARAPHVRLIPAGDLPPGWRGKVHALQAGESQAATPWLLLLDADARHSPELVARAQAAARAYGLEAVSLAGRQKAVGLGENLLVPAVFGLLDALLGDWRSAADGSGPAVASGQFILVDREAWRRCGGFATIRGEPLDDVALVRELRRNGFRTGFLREPGLEVRMYEGTRAAFLGWRRNLGAFLGTRLGLATGSLACLLVPVAALAAAAATGRWVEAAILWGAGAAGSMVVRRGNGSAPGYGLLYPLDVLFLALTLALGTRDRRRGRLASWKGRTIEVGKG